MIALLLSAISETLIISLETHGGKKTKLWLRKSENVEMPESDRQHVNASSTTTTQQVRLLRSL